jgi:hypothetical protein
MNRIKQLFKINWTRLGLLILLWGFMYITTIGDVKNYEYKLRYFGIYVRSIELFIVFQISLTIGCYILICTLTKPKFNKTAA